MEVVWSKYIDPEIFNTFTSAKAHPSSESDDKEEKK